MCPIMHLLSQLKAQAEPKPFQQIRSIGNIEEHEKMSAQRKGSLGNFKCRIPLPLVSPSPAKDDENVFNFEQGNSCRAFRDLDAIDDNPPDMEKVYFQFDKNKFAECKTPAIPKIFKK